MHPIDYVVIVLMCLASVGIGVFTSCTGGRQRSTSEYMMGNRQMNLLPVAISILVSFWSAISLLGGPAEIFYFGSYFNVTAVGITLACLICAYLFVPLFYPLQIISIFEYLELRYQAKFIRYWGTGLYVLTSILYLSVAQLAPAMALDAVMGIPQWGGILIIGGISIIYTALGGIKAVIWSDVFQSVFILIGLVAALIKATIDSGGPATVFETNSAWGRFETFNWSLDPRVRLTVWGSSIGVMLTWIPCYGPNQASFQRFASLPTLAKAKWSILLNIFGVYFFFALLAFVGYALFALYTVRGCDPFSDDAVSSINQLLPHYIKYDLNIPTLPGIIMACILSGAFSTTSTLLNSQAAVTVIDFVQPRWRLSDAAATVATKWLVLAYGVLGSALAFASSYIRNVPLIQISGSFISCSSGATLGIFLLAACVPKSTWRGAFAGSLVSLALVGWICAGSFTLPGGGPRMLPLETANCSSSSSLQGLHNNSESFNSSASGRQDHLLTGLQGLYSISFQWYGTVGSLTCFFVGLLVSLPNLLDPEAPLPEPRFILPPLRPFLCPPETYNSVPSHQNVDLKICHQKGGSMVDSTNDKEERQYL
ncbi:hypothetical protein BOX15_Mlig017156g1 [Macrostomum lignano]|uniref:Sodium-coupled monocarboxylate transporter 1 n=2 Tax=Macrostomum lignano TaxID=282301 RepID=A0A267FBV8_9PLAT|nr:hypothetical protein BOX15_Mlig017156g1 [Macrostomum lignano]